MIYSVQAVKSWKKTHIALNGLGNEVDGVGHGVDNLADDAFIGSVCVGGRHLD